MDSADLIQNPPPSPPPCPTSRQRLPPSRGVCRPESAGPPPSYGGAPAYGQPRQFDRQPRQYGSQDFSATGQEVRPGKEPPPP